MNNSNELDITDWVQVVDIPDTDYYVPPAVYNTSQVREIVPQDLSDCILESLPVTPPEPQAQKSANTPVTSDSKLQLQLTAAEHEILKLVAEGATSPRAISTRLGIPQATIARFLAKDDVKKYAQELIDARNLALKSYLPNLLMEIIDAKVQQVQENPDASLADVSKKDVVDIARVLNELLKANDASSSAQDTKLDSFSNIYAQINNIQLNNN